MTSIEPERIDELVVMISVHANDEAVLETEHQPSRALEDLAGRSSSVIASATADAGERIRTKCT